MFEIPMSSHGFVLPLCGIALSDDRSPGWPRLAAPPWVRVRCETVHPERQRCEAFFHPPSGRVARNERGGLSDIPAVSDDDHRIRPPRALGPDPPGGRVNSVGLSRKPLFLWAQNASQRCLKGCHMVQCDVNRVPHRPTSRHIRSALTRPFFRGCEEHLLRLGQPSGDLCGKR